MLTQKEQFLRARDRCNSRADHSHGAEIASMWREIAESYRLLATCEVQHEAARQAWPQTWLPSREERLLDD